MRITIIGCIVLLFSVLTVSQWPGYGMGGYGGGYGMGGFGGGFGGGYGGGLVPFPTYSYELPSSYSYTPAGVSLVGNTYTFTPPVSNFGALTTYNVNQTSPQYLQPPPFAFGGTGWNQGWGFGGHGGHGGHGGIGGYNTMGFPGFGGQGFSVGQGGYDDVLFNPTSDYTRPISYSRPSGYSTLGSSRGYSRGHNRGYPSSYSRGYSSGYLGRP